jgi:hypothetical protein
LPVYLSGCISIEFLKLRSSCSGVVVGPLKRVEPVAPQSLALRRALAQSLEPPRSATAAASGAPAPRETRDPMAGGAALGNKTAMRAAVMRQLQQVSVRDTPHQTGAHHPIQSSRRYYSTQCTDIPQHTGAHHPI